MKRPIESDYISLTAYTRALEEYCEALAQPEQEPVASNCKHEWADDTKDKPAWRCVKCGSDYKKEQA